MCHIVLISRTLTFLLTDVPPPCELGSHLAGSSQLEILLGVLKCHGWRQNPHVLSSAAAVSLESFVGRPYAMINDVQTLNFESKPERPKSFLAHQQG